ncbi:MAG: hypothetical protein CBD27_10355 [Rhodospirillaceae bacterium TMED167]|nr:hypothetical protein [Rhodospirillaceae bacterium]OUW24889.1 MAG: hypothetical protein CBD27_10355 [Rhodospirillaceae bacterium TMED167]
MDEQKRIVNVFLDHRTVVRRQPEVDHDRAVAIFDLLEENFFDLVGGLDGPYNLHLSVEENRLLFGVCDETDYPVTNFSLPISNFRSIVKDYFVICDSYYDAIKVATPSRIEAIDMGRRGLHNEGSQVLQDRLAPYVKIDFDTARRLFTLICVLHQR